jgi:hypothetical protein
MIRKTLLALAVGGIFAASISNVYAQGDEEKKDTQLILSQSDEEKKDTQLILSQSDEEKKYTQLIL